MGINSAVPYRKTPTANDTPKKPQTVIMAGTVEQAPALESDASATRAQPRNGSAKTMRARHSGSGGSVNGSTHRDAKLHVYSQEQLGATSDDDRDTSWASYGQGNGSYNGRDF